MQLEKLEKDAKLLIAAISLSGLLKGYLEVIRAIYLSLLGFNPVMIGLLITVASISGSLRNALYGILADKLGRKKIIILAHLTSLIYFLVYVFSTDYTIFLVAAIICGTGIMAGAGGGVAYQALLTEKTNNETRTIAFSAQFFSSSVCATIGALLTSLPDFLEAQYNMDTVISIRSLFAIGIVLGIVSILLILLVKEDRPKIATVIKEEMGEQRATYKRSWMLMAKFSVISSLWGIGNSMSKPLIPLWFYLTFNIELKTLGFIFAFSKASETFTYLIAPVIAEKIGLVKSVVTSRLVGALCLGLMTFAQTPIIAAIFHAGHNAIQNISLPLRSSYMMAVLKPEERASAGGIIQLSSSATRSLAPTLGGYLFQEVSASLPIFVSTVVFAVGDTLFYLFFNKLKPPEERKQKGNM